MHLKTISDECRSSSRLKMLAKDKPTNQPSKTNILTPVYTFSKEYGSPGLTKSGFSGPKSNW